MPSKKKFMLPEFKFRVPVRYDLAFRKRTENERLRAAHPKVKKIHVAHRDESQKSRNGIKYVSVTIAAPNKKIAQECFDDGNRKVMERMRENKNHSKTRRAPPRRRTPPRRRRTPPKSKKKTPSPKNNRPVHYFSEEVTAETDWGDFMERCDEYQKKHPEVKVIC